jgi:hypothetical protein
MFQNPISLDNDDKDKHENLKFENDLASTDNNEIDR